LLQILHCSHTSPLHRQVNERISTHLSPPIFLAAASLLHAFPNSTNCSHICSLVSLSFPPSLFVDLIGMLLCCYIQRFRERRRETRVGYIPNFNVNSFVNSTNVYPNTFQVLNFQHIFSSSLQI